jgi:hypothetical protein
MTIGFIYLPFAPLITPFVIVYFCIGFCVMKYNLLYVYKHRCGGGLLVVKCGVHVLLVFDLCFCSIRCNSDKLIF